MLKLPELIDAQKKGEVLLKDLQEDEKTIIQGYAQMAAQQVVQVGAGQRAPVSEVVMNAFRVGVALGSQINITNGTIERRS